MKTAPITVTEIAVIGGACVVGFLAWRAYSSLPSPDDAVAAIKKSIADGKEAVVTAPADFVVWTANNNKTATDQAMENLRAKYPNQRTGVQDWVAETVLKGQDAGASSFITSFFIGLTK